MARARNEIQPESRSEGDDKDADANEIVWRFIPSHRQQPVSQEHLVPRGLGSGTSCLLADVGCSEQVLQVRGIQGWTLKPGEQLPLPREAVAAW